MTDCGQMSVIFTVTTFTVTTSVVTVKVTSIFLKMIFKNRLLFLWPIATYLPTSTLVAKWDCRLFEACPIIY